MPTYAYRCEHCGHASDEWLKISEATAERTCPNCGHASYRKQVTAPAFQLKGSGWYVTDFRGGSGGKKADGTKDGAKESSGGASSEGASESKGDSGSGSKDGVSTSSSGSPAPAPASVPDKSS